MGATPSQGKGHGVLHHIQKRVGIAIDMTPMVDIAFLLLIFFMLTTVFRLPQAMELVYPKDDVPVAESNVLTLYVYGDGQFVYRTGADGPLQPVDFSGLRATIAGMSRQNDKLITLVKFERATPYHWMVDVIDEFILGHVSRYSFDAMTPEERAEIQSKVGA
jgi:biopolymer transport protein ExbD